MTPLSFEAQLYNSNLILVPLAIAERFISLNINRIIILVKHYEMELEFHGALRKNNGLYVIMFSKQKQKTINVFPNDFFMVYLRPDTSTYGIEMPEEFKEVLQSDPISQELFESLTPGKKRSLIHHILRTKSTQLRIDKALIITENLKKGISDLRQLIKKP